MKMSLWIKNFAIILGALLLINSLESCSNSVSSTSVDNSSNLTPIKPRAFESNRVYYLNIDSSSGFSDFIGWVVANYATQRSMAASNTVFTSTYLHTTPLNNFTINIERPGSLYFIVVVQTAGVAPVGFVYNTNNLYIEGWIPNFTNNFNNNVFYNYRDGDLRSDSIGEIIRSVTLPSGSVYPQGVIVGQLALTRQRLITTLRAINADPNSTFSTEEIGQGQDRARYSLAAIIGPILAESLRFNDVRRTMLDVMRPDSFGSADFQTLKGNYFNNWDPTSQELYTDLANPNPSPTVLARIAVLLGYLFIAKVPNPPK
jgi:hypothetical protein